MNLIDRLKYALIGFIFGAGLGLVCWWLYGLGLSLRLYRPGLGSSIRHWVLYAGAVFAFLGFLFRDGVGDAVGNAFGAIFDFEAGSHDGRGAWLPAVLFLLVLGGLVAWFVTR